MEAPPDGDALLDRDRPRLMRQAELAISFVLRGGVVLSAGIVALGSAVFYARSLVGGYSARAGFPHSPGAVVAGLLAGDPLAIIMLGLLVLLLTPVLRIIVSIVTFSLERDWLYTAITTLVLLILIVSFLLGLGGA